MNDNNMLDDWLNSLEDMVAENVHSVTPSVLEESPQEPQETPLTESDIEDILQEYGVTTIQDAEEITDEDSGEEEGVVNTDEELVPFDENGRPIRIADGLMAQVNALDNSQAEIHDGYVRPVYIEGSRAVEAIEGMIAQAEEAYNNAMNRANVSPVAEVEVSADPSNTSDTSDAPHHIQPNSPTLLIDESTSRFSGTEWYEKVKQQNIIIAGLGGIGSNCAYQIARLTPSTIVLYDDDIVDAANMSGQLFSSADVGSSKVGAMQSMLSRYTTMQNVFAIQRRFTLNDPDIETGNIMICGFDNMVARKEFYIAWEKHVHSLPKEDRQNCLFIDGRLSIDVLQVLCIRGDDTYNMGMYKEKYLFSDEQAQETICSMKQTTYLACMIGSIMTNLFINHIANLTDPAIPYDLPFFTEYEAQHMLFKTVS